jgi:hypothetical protein
VNLNLNNARNDSGAVARSPAMAARTTPPQHVMLAVRSGREMQLHTDAHLVGGAGLGEPGSLYTATAVNDWLPARLTDVFAGRSTGVPLLVSYRSQRSNSVPAGAAWLST